MLDLKKLASWQVSRLLAIALVLALLLVPAGVASLGALATPPGPLAACDDSLCWDGCNAKEIQAISLWLGDCSTGQRQQQCEQGTAVSTCVWATINANTTRYAPMIRFDLLVDGVPAGHYNICFTDVLSSGEHSYATLPITWTCGSELVAQNLALGWDVSKSATCASNPCCPGTPAKCQVWPADLIIVSPLVADFTATSPCAVTAVQFTDATTGGTAPYTYTWDFGDGGTTSVQDPTHLFAAPGSYTVALTVTDSTTPALTDWVTHTVTVRAAPVADISATPGLTLTCNVQNIVLGAGATGGSGAYSYAWDLDNDGSYDDGTALTTTVSAAGTYHLLVTDTYGCTDTDSVSVAALEPVDVQIAATPGLTLTCSTDAITLTASATGGDGYYTYAWDLDNDGQYNDGTGTTQSVAAAGIYGVRVTDGSGCTDTASVTVDDHRDLDVQITADPGLVLTCSVGDITLTASASGGSGSYTYAWDLDDDGQFDDGTGATQSVSAGGDYAVQVTNGAGCTDTASVTVEDHRNLDVQISADPGLVLTCSVGDITLTASASGGSGSYTYAWDLDGDGQFDDGTGATQSVSAGGDYAVQVTNGAGCTDTASVTVEDHRNLDVQISADPGLVLTCNVNAITLTASAFGGSGSYTYAWDLDDDGQFDDGTGATQSVSAGGDYAVQVTNGAGCTDTASVTVVDQRDLTVSIQASAMEVTCDAPSVTLTASASGGDGSYSYAWDLDDDGQFDDGTGDTQTVSAGGDYAVQATDGSGCTNTDSVTIGEDPCVPGLAIHKTGNRTSAKVGNVIQYTIVVENTGEDALTNVTVVDSKLGINTNLGTLEVGESRTITGSYKVEKHDLPGPIVNTAIATADGGLSDDDTWQVYLTTEPPKPCTRSDLSALIYGGWNGITVNADPGGSQSTALDSSGVAAVLWTFYLDPGQSLSVHVTPQLPADLNPQEWEFEPASRSVSLKACRNKQITFQLVHKQLPEELLLPVTGKQRGLLAIVADLWQSLVGCIRNLVK